MAEWKPSKRASELIGVLIEAFAAGDRWVRMEMDSTARFTGVSLVHNGIAEFDPASLVNGFYSRRIRISSDWAELNGWPNRDWRQAAAELNEEAA